MFLFLDAAGEPFNSVVCGASDCEITAKCLGSSCKKLLWAGGQQGEMMECSMCRWRGMEVTENTLNLILLSGNWKLMWPQDTEETK